MGDRLAYVRNSALPPLREWHESRARSPYWYLLPPLREWHESRARSPYWYLLPVGVLRFLGSIPTAPTSLLILYKGLAKSARQQKAAIRAKSVGQWQMRLAVRMASRRINPCTRATCPQLFAESCGEFLGWHFWRRRRCHTCNRSEGRF